MVAALPLAGDRTAARVTVTLPVTESGWYLLRAYGDRAVLPVLDRYPFASTSPIYVRVGDAPVRSPADAAYFVRWLDRLVAAARADTGWNAAREQAAVLARFERARAVYAGLAVSGAGAPGAPR